MNSLLAGLGEKTSSVKFRLLAAFALSSVMTLVAAVVGVTGFNSTNLAVSQITSRAIPETLAVDALSEASQGLSAVLQELALSSTSDARVENFERAVELRNDLSPQLEALRVLSDGGDLTILNEAVAELSGMVEGMNTSVDRRLTVRNQRRDTTNLARQGRVSLASSIETALDNSEEGDVESLLRALLAANQLLIQYNELDIAASDAEIDAIYDRYDEAAGELDINLALLERPASPLVRDQADILIGYGDGATGVFELRKAELAAIAQAEVFAAEARIAASALVTHVSAFKQQVAQRVDTATYAANSAVVTGRVVLIAIAAIGLGIAAGIGWFYVHMTLLKRISAMARTMRALAEGNSDVNLGFTPGNDEIGDMARSVDVFRQNAIERTRLEAETLEERRMKEKRAAAVESLIQAFEEASADAIGQVSAAANQMESAARTMSSTAAATTGKSAAVAHASEGASQNVQTVAAAAEEMVSSIGEISQQIARSTQIAGSAVDQVERTNGDVQRLDDAAKSIDDIVGLINDIAEQTNLLALNATIEAARAGEAGKGFAVVASEVKALASQTGAATQNISEHISGIQSATSKAVEAMSSIGGTIHEMSEIATAIAAAMEEQRAAAGEITRSAQEAADGTRDVFANIQEVDRATSETGESAGEVLEASLAVSRQSGSLKTSVEQFLTEVRSA
ncbi:methyl-accepting chemotaxis protein [Maricaulis salignorans]|uniref:Methyl-accepting chemotaxis protein n=1 Tax=Maricaulis salignorans TaxID=144026 RepID=A0A1G9MWJ6_9PROT|nr:methyl-accepting chemotaxis protein [Maricaulis salignorans]SDL78598.1 methyl-accepting chemotaxis protein [Maricaulis salignorans]